MAPEQLELSMGMSGDFEQAVSSAVGTACVDRTSSWPASTAIIIMQHQATKPHQAEGLRSVIHTVNRTLLGVTGKCWAMQASMMQS